MHIRSGKPSTIVHVDLWDPYPIDSVNSMRYFLLFVDDCT